MSSAAPSLAVSRQHSNPDDFDEVARRQIHQHMWMREAVASTVAEHTRSRDHPSPQDVHHSPPQRLVRAETPPLHDHSSLHPLHVEPTEAANDEVPNTPVRQIFHDADDILLSDPVENPPMDSQPRIRTWAFIGCALFTMMTVLLSLSTSCACATVGACEEPMLHSMCSVVQESLPLVGRIARRISSNIHPEHEPLLLEQQHELAQLLDQWETLKHWHRINNNEAAMEQQRSQHEAEVEGLRQRLSSLRESADVIYKHVRDHDVCARATAFPVCHQADGADANSAPQGTLSASAMSRLEEGTAHLDYLLATVDARVTDVEVRLTASSSSSYSQSSQSDANSSDGTPNGSSTLASENGEMMIAPIAVDGGGRTRSTMLSDMTVMQNRVAALHRDMLIESADDISRLQAHPMADLIGSAVK